MEGKLRIDAPFIVVGIACPYLHVTACCMTASVSKNMYMTEAPECSAEVLYKKKKSTVKLSRKLFSEVLDSFF